MYANGLFVQTSVRRSLSTKSFNRLSQQHRHYEQEQRTENTSSDPNPKRPNKPEYEQSKL